MPQRLAPSGVLPLANGGTGSTSAASARFALALKGAALLDVGTVSGTVMDGADSRVTGAQAASAKGVANGYASLDGTGKVPPTQLPTDTSRLARAGDTMTGELVLGASGSGARFTNGTYGLAHFTDGSAYYILLTASGSPLSTSYTSARPLTINFSTGAVAMATGVSVTGGLSADTLNLTNDLSIANGGTGSSTAAGALAALGAQPALGYTPVQQGTGVGQGTNTIKLGWSGSKLKATVDATDLGNLASETWVSGLYALSNNTVLTGTTTLGSQTVTGTTTGSIIGSNIIFNAGWKYVADGYGYFIRADNPGVSFNVAGSGTAGQTASFVPAWSASPTGVLTVGNIVVQSGTITGLTTPLPIASGGTGGATAAAARAALGLATVAATGLYADLLNPPSIPAPSSTVPLQDGTGTAGTSAAYAREGHVHPTDATRAPLANPSFTGNAFNFGLGHTASTTAFEAGSLTTANLLYWDLHTSGNNIDYDVRLSFSGGTTTAGQGSFGITAASFTWNGAAVLSAATPVTIAQGGTGATTAAAALSALGAAPLASPTLTNPTLTGVVTLGGAGLGPINFGLSGQYVGWNVAFNSGFKYVANDNAFWWRNDGASGVSFHAAPAGSAGATIPDTVAMIVSTAGVVSFPINPLGVGSGGTGANSAAGARTALGAAASSTPAIAGAPVITVGADLVGERFVSGNFGVVDYYDGANYYALVTNSGQQLSTNYSGLRPFHFSLTTGLVGMDNGVVVQNGLTTDTLTVTGPFNVTTQGATTARSLASHLADIPSVQDWAAVGNGTNDDTALIQAALNAVANGSRIRIPPLTYRITDTVTIGNGSSSAPSSKWGIVLAGPSPAPFPSGFFAGFPNTGTAKFVWAGASGGTMIKVAGPLNGWGLENIYLDGAGVAGVGLDVLSASNGVSNGLSFTGFTNAAIREDVLTSYTGFGLANSMHNAYDNIAIQLPNVNGAKGIVQLGRPTASPVGANSCFGRFTNITFNAPTSTPATAQAAGVQNNNATFGFYLQWTDTNYYENIHYIGGNQFSAAVLLDYTLTTTSGQTTTTWNNLPSSCTFICLDVSGNGAGVNVGPAGSTGTANAVMDVSRQFVNNGVPGNGARPNYVKGVGEINLGSQPMVKLASGAQRKSTTIANLRPDLPQVVDTLLLDGQTQPISNSALFTPYELGMYRTSFYLRITAGGAQGNITARITVDEGFGSPVNLDLNPSVNATIGATFGTIVYRAKPDSPVNYSVVFNNTTTAPTYSLNMTTERIG